jgi:hypothetical protein
MMTFLRKHTALILISLLLAMCVLAWSFPSARPVLGIVFLSLSFLIVSSTLVHKHMETYRKEVIPRSVFLRNIALDLTGTGLAMISAGLLARVAAELTTRQIDDNLLRFTAGILLGLSIGLVVGSFVKQTWGRFVKTPS